MEQKGYIPPPPAELKGVPKEEVEDDSMPQPALLV